MWQMKWTDIFLSDSKASVYDVVQLQQNIANAYFWCREEIQSLEKSTVFFACTVIAAVGDEGLFKRHNLHRELIENASIKSIKYYMDLLSRTNLDFPRGEYEEELEEVIKKSRKLRNYIVHRYLLPSPEMEDVLYVASMRHEIEKIHEYMSYANARINDAAYYLRKKSIWMKKIYGIDYICGEMMYVYSLKTCAKGRIFLKFQFKTKCIGKT